MTAETFVDTNVLVYSRDAAAGAKQQRASDWLEYCRGQHGENRRSSVRASSTAKFRIDANLRMARDCTPGCEGALK